MDHWHFIEQRSLKVRLSSSVISGVFHFRLLEGSDGLHDDGDIGDGDNSMRR